MRKLALFLVVLSLALVAGCGVELPTPSPSPAPVAAPTSAPPTSPPPTTSSSETATDVPVASDVEPIPGSASCVAAPVDFPTESRIPPISEEDHVHGSADGSITFIEYADFQ